MDELKKFLVAAKVNGYATGGEEKEIKLEDNGRQFKYADGEFKYRDTYYGFNPFIGQELVWKNNQGYWIMNYYGKLTSNTLPAKEVYTFLKTAMQQVSEDRPFRGPSHFQQGDLEYRDENQGAIESFTGIEMILYKGQEIYKLFYHGGLVN